MVQGPLLFGEAGGCGRSERRVGRGEVRGCGEWLGRRQLGERGQQRTCGGTGERELYGKRVEWVGRKLEREFQLGDEERGLG